MKDVSKKISTPTTVEEYIQFELTSETRHEFINGQLIEMPGERKINNKIAGAIYVSLLNRLSQNGYDIFNHGIKVANNDRTKYFYPDVSASKKTSTEENEYIQYDPELIVEVISHQAELPIRLINTLLIQPFLH